jgi:hypothetical protein
MGASHPLEPPPTIHLLDVRQLCSHGRAYLRDLEGGRLCGYLHILRTEGVQDTNSPATLANKKLGVVEQ